MNKYYMYHDNPMYLDMDLPGQIKTAGRNLVAHHTDDRLIQAIYQASVLDNDGAIAVENHESIPSKTNTLISVGKQHQTMEVAMSNTFSAIVSLGTKNQDTNFQVAHVVRAELCKYIQIDDANPSKIYILHNMFAQKSSKTDNLGELYDITTGQGLAAIMLDAIDRMNATKNVSQQQPTVLNINNGDFQPTAAEMQDLEPAANYKSGYFQQWEAIRTYIESPTVSGFIMSYPAEASFMANKENYHCRSFHVGARTMLVDYLLTHTLKNGAKCTPADLAYKIIRILPHLKNFKCPLLASTANAVIEYLESSKTKSALDQAVRLYGYSPDAAQQHITEFIQTYKGAPEYDISVVAVKELLAPTDGLENITDLVNKAAAISPSESLVAE